jgi:uncharacterized protein YegP (UPF0339 family)
MMQRMTMALGMGLAFWVGGMGEILGPSAQLLAGEGKLKFEIYPDAKEDYRWRLKGSDDKVLATAGQSFTAKADCKKSVERMMTKLDKQKFEVYEDKGKEFRWRLINAKNGQTVATSGGSYATKADCETAIDVIKKGAPKASVSELKSKDKE